MSSKLLENWHDREKDHGDNSDQGDNRPKRLGSFVMHK